jgi:hypothetical protein
MERHRVIRGDFGGFGLVKRARISQVGQQRENVVADRWRIRFGAAGSWCATVLRLWCNELEYGFARVVIG